MKEKILKLRSEGMSYRDISKATGMSVGAISWHINNPTITRGETKKECIRLRKKGMTMQSISDKLGISVNTVYFHCHHLGVKIDRQPERRNEIIRLAKLGFDNNIIALNMGIKKSSVYQVLYKSGFRSGKWDYDNTEEMQACQGLFIDGYSKEEISLYTGFRLSEVKKYTKGCKIYKIKRPVGRPIKPKVMKMKQIKKIKKEIVPHEVSRDYLGKGFEKGAMPTVVVLNPERDKGRSITFLYSNFSDNPTVRTTIMVRDESVSDEEAVERWCKKLSKKSWKLIK